jgi:hypothetical protein
MITHPVTAALAGTLVLFLSLLNAENGTGAGWLFEDVVQVHTTRDPGDLGRATYEVLRIDGQVEILTDSRPGARDSFARAHLFYNERVATDASEEWYSVLISRSTHRHTGLVFPIRAAEEFRLVAGAIWSSDESVPEWVRRAALDEVASTWPEHADAAAALQTQDRVTFDRLDPDGVVMELICYALIAIVVGSIWRACATRATTRAMQSAEPAS